MASKNAELRVSNGSTFDGVDQLIYMRSHKDLVDGLFGGDGKILEALLPNSVYGGLRFVDYAGGSTHDTTTELKTLADSYVTSNGGTTRGAFFIFNATTTVTVSTLHQVRTESGLVEAAGTFSVNPGDWLVCTDESGSSWAVINNTYLNATTSIAGLMSASDKQKLDGLSNYTHHSQAALSIDATDVETIDGITVNTEGHVTAISKQAIRAVSQSVSGLMSAADKTKLDGIASGANNYSLPVAAIDVLGGVKVGARLTISAGVLNANLQSDNNFTTVLKNKLDGIEEGANLYTAPSDGANTTLTLGGIEKIAGITVQSDGRVTAVSKENIQSATESLQGVIEIATATEAKAGSDNSKALTPASGKAMIDLLAGLKAYSSIATADADIANNPSGKLALIFV